MKVLRHRLVEDDGTAFPFERSPNSGGDVEHDLLVVHYTAGSSAESSVDWFKNPLAKASAHLVIGRDGSIVQMVPFDRVAWHAGISEWQGRSGVNGFSLGIELDDAGKLMPHGDRWLAWFGKEYGPEEVLVATHKNETEPFGWHLYTEAQLEAAVTVASVLVDRYDLRDVVGHDDVSPIRKVDPGPAFPMASFRARVLGREDDEPEILETSTTLNIRSGPGTLHETLREGPLPPGTRVEVLAMEGLWRLVDVLDVVGGAMDVQGWVHGRFLRRLASGAPSPGRV
ncbi:MAG: N-acetylmuramoyl-L-alanine amidase [Thermoanaerobaculia bacterium]